MNTFQDLQEYLPFLIPLFILQIILMVTALTMLIRQGSVKYLNKPIWAVIIILLNIIGPVIYLVLERRA